MDENRAGCHAGQYWIDEAQTAKPVTLLQALHEAVAQHTHRLLFEPARARHRSDNDYLRSMRLLQALSECGGDAPGGKILAFNVDVTPRGGDGVEVEGLNFPHFRAAGIGRVRTSKDDINVRDVRLNPARPGVSMGLPGRTPRAEPTKSALTHELRQV